VSRVLLSINAVVIESGTLPSATPGKKPNSSSASSYSLSTVNVFFHVVMVTVRDVPKTSELYHKSNILT
jgi:hypothetical protein